MHVARLSCFIFVTACHIIFDVTMHCLCSCSFHDYAFNALSNHWSDADIAPSTTGPKLDFSAEMWLDHSIWLLVVQIINVSKEFENEEQCSTSTFMLQRVWECGAVQHIHILDWLEFSSLGHWRSKFSVPHVLFVTENVAPRLRPQGLGLTPPKSLDYVHYTTTTNAS